MATAGAVLAAGSQVPVARVDFRPHGVLEVALASDRDYANPFWDVTVTVAATAPSGRRQLVEAFWDGGRTWRARVAGDEAGAWSWAASSTDASNRGLAANGRVNHAGARPPSRLVVSKDGTHLIDERGAPFFWLADTAWNGALRSTEGDWREYLARRAAQRFSAIQFVATQWRGGDKVIPRHVFQGTERITIDPDAFAVLDARVAAVVAAGLRPVPVMLWALNPTDPGRALPEADAIRLARYQLARWGAVRPVWFLGGDGRYLIEGAPDRWTRIGRAVFADQSDQLATLHPSGQSWIADAFAGEAWLDFVGYQSGHGDGDAQLRWLVSGPPTNWTGVGKPIINLEPNYEGHPAYQSKQPHSALNVRRAAWWSMLVHPPAGVSYGNNEIWVWNTETADAENHANLRQIRPWREGLETEGIEGMTRLRAIIESGPWTSLRPAQHLLAEQPGAADPRRFIAVAQRQDAELTIAYLPAGGAIRFATVPPGLTIWISPRDEERQIARPEPDDRSFVAPDERDWVFMAGVVKATALRLP
jgi:hypothetical protein